MGTQVLLLNAVLFYELLSVFSSEERTLRITV